LHLHAPVRSKAHTPQLVAAEYLHQFADLLGLTAGELKNLSLPPSPTIENAKVEYRFLQEKHQFDTATVAFYQTDLGLPVWQAGVAVQMKMNPFRVLSSQSTRHPDINVKRPSAEATRRAEAITETQLSHQLGLDQPNGTWERDTLKIENRQLVIYQYERAKRVPIPPEPVPSDSTAKQQPALTGPPPTLPLPPVDNSIVEGHHYVCVKVNFILAIRPVGELHWVAIVEVNTLSVLYLRAFVDSVNGLVFEIDPDTTNGGPAPGATAAALNAVRVSDALEGLVAPVGGTQSLVGDNVQLAYVRARASRNCSSGTALPAPPSSAKQADPESPHCPQRTRPQLEK
jgi:hypothetical protein